MTSYKDSGKILNWVNGTGSAVVSGAVLVIGAVLGIAQNAVASLATGAVYVSGRFSVDAPGDEAWTAGQRIYWDSVAENFTTTVSAYFAGCAAAAKAETATTGYLLLNQASPIVAGAHIADPAAAAAQTQDTLTDSTGGVAATTLPAAGAATTHTITDSSTGTASTTEVPEITEVANTGSADLAPVENAVATLLAEDVLLAADIAAVRGEVAILAASLAAQFAKVKADHAAALTAIAANNTAIDSTLARLESVGINLSS